MNDRYSIVIIGAGPAGIGLGAAMQHYGLSNFVILDKDGVGATFDKWNPETHFISPSFTSNGFGFPDLNAITPDTSPAFSLNAEHPNGHQYAEYLRQVALLKHLPVIGNANVINVKPQNGGYELLLSSGEHIDAQYVFFGLRDYSYPLRPQIPGKDDGLHYADIRDYGTFAKQPQAIIGGNESGIDVAVNLAKRGIPSTIYTETTGLQSNDADPSKRLSTYTMNRFLAHGEMIHVISNKQVVAVKRTLSDYQLRFSDETTATSFTRPIFATGFAVTKSPLINRLFKVAHNRPVLNNMDESTISPNVFLIGPQVTHDQVVLCYIYKYRQRFAPLAEEMIRRKGLQPNPETRIVYQNANMYLDEFDDCDVNCEC
ncbi:NAD(P)/FAD-dependent oxidoreductase [Lentilactobacillus parakefiri]|uniref:NAD(P)/FAD-dependent oxidoreductase n=1 Tax=Lentilactobacillus parakefiri TaxID=152332 RepID=UPI0015CC9E75|nr:NAD(P)/FAD-dependent oxidoreductase [Lentilactobacillus parakefiri]